MKEIAERLHENRQIQLAKDILESNGYTVTKKEDIDEGIFGIKSKAEKQKEYDKIIKEVFGDSTHGIATNLFNIVSDIFSKIVVDHSSERHTQVRSEAAIVEVFTKEVKQSPDRVISLIEKLVSKHNVDNSYLDELNDLKTKSRELQRAGENNLGYKAKDYLFEKIGELIVPKLQVLAKSIEKDARYNK